MVLDGLAADVDEAYPAFVRAHADAVYTTALRLSGSSADADDIAQETFVRAYRALKRYDAARIGSLRPRAWLLAITVNLWRNTVRAAARRPLTRPLIAGDRSADQRDPTPGPSSVVEADEGLGCLAALVARLPEHHRIPVVLRHVVGLSYDELSVALECPVGTVKAHVSRGVRELRRLAAANPAFESKTKTTPMKTPPMKTEDPR